MGYIEGLLSGYLNQSNQIEKQKMDEAVRANDRESRIYEALLSSPDEEIRSMAATGMLQTGDPRRRMKGIKGWMGEVQGNPMFPQLQQYLRTPRQYTDEVEVPGLASVQTTGMLTQAPGPSGSMALPDTSPTTLDQPTPLEPPPPGSTGLQAAQSMEDQSTGLTAPSGLQSAQSLEGQATGIAAPPPPFTTSQPNDALFRTGIDVAQPPPPPAQVPTASQPMAWRGKQTFVPGPEIGRVDTQQVTRLPRAFPTAEDTAVSAARAKSLGDITGDFTGYREMFKRAGDPNPSASAADFMKQLAMKQGAGGLGMSYAEGNIVPDASSPTGFSQELYLRSNPNVKTKIPALSPNTPEYMAQKAQAVGDVRATMPLSSQAKFQGELSLRDDWRQLSQRATTARTAVDEMKAAYNQALASGDISAAAEAIQVLFQKSLDPPSVVRESEANRPREFQGLATRVEGALQQLKSKGGGPIPFHILAQYVTLSDQITKAAEAFAEDQASIIHKMATDGGLDPTHILPSSYITRAKQILEQQKQQQQQQTPGSTGGPAVASPPPAVSTTPNAAPGSGAATQEAIPPTGTYFAADGSVYVDGVKK